MRRPCGRRKPDVPGVKFLVIFREFVGQDGLPRETDGNGTLEIVNIDTLPIIRAKRRTDGFVDGPFPINDNLVICVVKDNLVTPIVICVIRVIGFRRIEKTKRENTTRRGHVHIKFGVPRVWKLKGPIDQSRIGCRT